MSNKPVKKGPHNIRGGGTQRGKQGGGQMRGNLGKMPHGRPMVVREKNPQKVLAVVPKGGFNAQVGKGGAGKISAVVKNAWELKNKNRKVNPTQK